MKKKNTDVSNGLNASAWSPAPTLLQLTTLTDANFSGRDEFALWVYRVLASLAGITLIRRPAEKKQTTITMTISLLLDRWHVHGVPCAGALV
jgi:hypothetical protein